MLIGDFGQVKQVYQSGGGGGYSDFTERDNKLHNIYIVETLYLYQPLLLPAWLQKTLAHAAIQSTIHGND